MDAIHHYLTASKIALNPVNIVQEDASNPRSESHITEMCLCFRQTPPHVHNF